MVLVVLVVLRITPHTLKNCFSVVVVVVAVVVVVVVVVVLVVVVVVVTPRTLKN